MNLFNFAKIFIFIVLSILVGLGTSGTNSRDYQVLEDTTKITLGTEKLSVRQMIEKYKPKNI